MMLVERGLLDLDRPANDYLPGSKFAAGDRDASDATLGRLLNHTSGRGVPLPPELRPDGARGALSGAVTTESRTLRPGRARGLSYPVALRRMPARS